MFDDTTLVKGKVEATFGSFNASRNPSALIASSPRTAYSTLRTAGLRSSTEIIVVEVESRRRWLLTEACNRKRVDINLLLIILLGDLGLGW